MGKGEARGLYVPSGRPCVPDNVALRQNPFRPKVRVGADEPAPIIGLLKQLPLGNGIMLTDFSRLPARWTWVAVMTYDDVMFTLGSLCDPGHFVSHELDQINRVQTDKLALTLNLKISRHFGSILSRIPVGDVEIAEGEHIRIAPLAWIFPSYGIDFGKECPSGEVTAESDLSELRIAPEPPMPCRSRKAFFLYRSA